LEGVARVPALRCFDDGLAGNAVEAAQRLGQSDAEMMQGVYSYAARENDLRIAAQLGKILDPSGPFQKGKGAAVDQQPLVN